MKLLLVILTVKVPGTLYFDCPDLAPSTECTPLGSFVPRDTAQSISLILLGTPMDSRCMLCDARQGTQSCASMMSRQGRQHAWRYGRSHMVHNVVLGLPEQSSEDHSHYSWELAHGARIVDQAGDGLLRLNSPKEMPGPPYVPSPMEGQ